MTLKPKSFILNIGFFQTNLIIGHRFPSYPIEKFNFRHAERLNGMLQSTKGDIAIGGKIDVDNKFLEPTVITGVTLEDSTMQVSFYKRESSV